MGWEGFANDKRKKISLVPPPTQSSLPFCAGVQFSRDPIRAFMPEPGPLDSELSTLAMRSRSLLKIRYLIYMIEIKTYICHDLFQLNYTLPWNPALHSLKVLLTKCSRKRMRIKRKARIEVAAHGENALLGRKSLWLQLLLFDKGFLLNPKPLGG